DQRCTSRRAGQALRQRLQFVKNPRSGGRGVEQQLNLARGIGGTLRVTQQPGQGACVAGGRAVRDVQPWVLIGADADQQCVAVGKVYPIGAESWWEGAARGRGRCGCSSQRSAADDADRAVDNSTALPSTGFEIDRA